MTARELSAELHLVQELVTGLVEELDDESYRRQYHPDLSALGWHLGHCTYIECYWLQEILQGDDRFTAPVARLYTPTLTPKPDRGAQLPPLQTLLQWTRGLQSINHDTLADPAAPLHRHELMQAGYLVDFLIQHYSQHFETMLMCLAQRALSREPPEMRISQPLTPRPPQPETHHVDAGHYRVGGKPPGACDNELPAQQATLGPYDIARRPVSNSEYLAFMQAGGYREPSFWTEAGRDWCRQYDIDCPQHWRRDPAGNWYGTGIRGPYELAGDDVLHGICWHEARAFAAWAGARLPHEHQWEVACRLHLLEQTGRAWEWCDNTFYPYEGFRAFPYREYSSPWFDDRHYTLRGGSLHTRPAIRRASFRNFYQPDKRHIFAGLRLVY